MLIGELTSKLAYLKDEEEKNQDALNEKQDNLDKMKANISNLEDKNKDTDKDLKELNKKLARVQKDVELHQVFFHHLNEVKVVLNRLAPFIDGNKSL